MSRLIDIEYEASQLISNCNEELSHIKSEINSKERSLKEVEKRSGMDKLFHMGDIRRKKEMLKKEIDDLKRRQAIVEKERAYYSKWGTKIPEGEAGKEMRKLLEIRQEKLDILTMIECGLM